MINGLPMFLTKTFAEAVPLLRILFQLRPVLPELLAKYCHNLQESLMEWPHGYRTRWLGGRPCRQAKRTPRC